jgi:signal transduction histidine kinase
MMLVVFGLTALGLYLAQRSVATTAEHDLQQSFQAELSSMHKLQELRHATVAERCRELALKPRIHAALEDNALDLLYPSAKDELRDLMQDGERSSADGGSSLHATFYRFLDSNGVVLPPPNPKEVGELTPRAEAQLSFTKLPDVQQTGYISRLDRPDESVDELTAIPIVSTETAEIISALVVGFKPLELPNRATATGMKSGIFVNRRLHLPSLPKLAQQALASEITTVIAGGARTQSNFRVHVNGTSYLLFFKQLNPGSLFPPAYEICIHPLTSAIAQLHRLRLQIGSAGLFLLLAGFVASHFVAVRFSKPVEQLAIDSEESQAQRQQAEAALASAAEELERSTRYSADASHQLKSPVTVLRSSLETLLARDDLKPEVYEELSALLHQTHRLTGVIDDLLLLSRMDAGHLEIKSETVDLSQLVEEWLDDLSALPDSPDVKIEKQIPSNLYIAGEKQYTSLIVQNLLENARKYNRTGGCIRVGAQVKNGDVFLTIGNTGRPIAPAAQEHIFERFHRGGTRSAVSGHGLGLNLACELARLHGGDLMLVCSGDDWTEFELRLRAAQPPPERVS